MVQSYKTFIVVLLCMLLLDRPASGSGLQCERCHQKVYEEIARASVRHPDFIQRDCVGCHLSRRNNSPRSSDARHKENAKTMRVDLRHYNDEHIAILNNLANDAAYQVKIKLIDRDGRKSESEMLTFVPSSISEFWSDDRTSPLISNIMVDRIDMSVFTSGEIIWETDELSDSKVEYGHDDYQYSSGVDIYTKKHAIKLNILDKNKKYHFRVISSDLFGNKSISADHTFDTSTPFNFGHASAAKGHEKKNPEFKNIRILRFKPEESNLRSGRDGSIDSVLLHFIATSEVMSVIEYSMNKPDNIKGAVSAEDAHGKVILKKKRELSIDACVERCHKQDASHPVGVSARGNIRIPDNLPTSDGKVITCITCHMPHGGKERYLARMNFERNLCVLCHIDGL
jgi:predicted CXXCH cytochrome family protein